MLFGLCCAVIALALVCGGGAHSGCYGDIVLQLLSIPLLLGSLWPAFSHEFTDKTRARMAIALCATSASVVILQIVPLPFDVWSGRHVLLPDGDSARFGGASLGWSTLSMTPQATWAAAVSLLVPLSVFASVVQLDFRQRMIVCWIVLGVGAVSLALGFLQVAQGPDSALQFYKITNPTEAVGFFANRNHFAAFMNVTLVLAALWLTQRLDSSFHKGALTTASFLWLAVAVVLVVALVAGIALARSRAGAILAIAMLVGIVFMVLAHSRSGHARDHKSRKTPMARVSLAVALFAVVFTLQAGLGRLLPRFEADLADDLRVPFNRTTFETAFDALPFGTGLGSFVPVYATVEKSQDVIAAFVNRAHDDLAEFLLETGLVGACLVILFLVWLGRRCSVVWRRQPEGNWQSLLLRASTLIVVLLLAHSLVDYPLRTTPLAVVFAVFCAFLAAPTHAPFPDQPKPRRRTIIQERLKANPQNVDEPSPDIQWPISWRRESASINDR